MVDSEYSRENYESSKVGIGAIIKDRKMLRLVPVYLKTKKMCKHAVKRLTLLMKYIPDRYKTRQMSDKVILKNSGMLMFIHEKNRENAVDNYVRLMGWFNKLKQRWGNACIVASNKMVVGMVSEDKKKKWLLLTTSS